MTREVYGLSCTHNENMKSLLSLVSSSHWRSPSTAASWSACCCTYISCSRCERSSPGVSRRALELLAGRFLEDASPSASSTEKQLSPARSSHEVLGKQTDASQSAPPSPGAHLFKHVEAAYVLYDKLVIDVVVLEACIGIAKFEENGSNAVTSKESAFSFASEVVCSMFN